MNENNRQVDERITHCAWALFLIMIGGVWLVPNDKLPSETWLIGAGIIMLGMNLVRYLKKVQVSTFTVILGCIAIFSGISNSFNVDLPVFPIIIIIIGVSMLFDYKK